MGMRVGVGMGRSRQAQKAFSEAFKGAMEKMEGRVPQCAIIFASAEHNQEELIASFKKELGHIPVVGCSAIGGIVKENCVEGGRFVSCTLLAGTHLDFQTFFLTAEELADNNLRKQKLTDSLKEHPTPSLVLLFPDGLKVNVDPLLRDVDALLPASVPVFGGTAGCRWDRWDKTFQYCNDQALNGGVTGLVVRGPLRTTCVISHGCDPYGTEFQVTAAEGNRLLALDGKPAWDVICEQLGFQSTFSGEMSGTFCVGERQIPGSEEAENYIMRAVLGVEPQTGALICGSEVRQGCTVVLHRRNAEAIATSAQEASAQLSAQAGQTQWTLQIDCAGRGEKLFGSRVTDLYQVPLVRESVSTAPDLPWTGVYSLGEIARRQGQSRLLNFTTVLVTMSEDSK